LLSIEKPLSRSFCFWGVTKKICFRPDGIAAADGLDLAASDRPKRVTVLPLLGNRKTVARWLVGMIA
jgi:hypothetical protein